jgi:hypothetical protein
MTSLRRWRAALGAAVWLCGAGAWAQGRPVEVVCDDGCRTLRVRGDRSASFRVRLLPGAVEVITPGAPGAAEQRLRLSLQGESPWRVTTTRAPPAARSPAPVRPPATPPTGGRRTVMGVAGGAAVTLGVVGLVVSLIPLAVRDAAAARFNQSCWLHQGEPDPGLCRALYDDMHAAHDGLIATLSLGGALLVGGVVTLALRPRDPSAPVVRPWAAASPGGLVGGVGGAF